MSWQFTPFVISLILTGIVSVVVAVVTLRRRIAPGSRPLAYFMFSVAEWAFCAGLEAAAVGIPAKIFWSQVEYLGIASSPIFFLLFAVEYARRDQWLIRRNLILVWIIPVVTIVIAATNEWHHLLWTSFTPIPGSNLLVYGHGSWLWVVVAYVYVILVAGTLLLVRTALHNRDIYRLQSVALLAGVPLPWLANIVYILDLAPLHGIDLTPIAFTLTGLFLTLGISQLHLFDLVPVARDAMIESMSDGVLVLDTQNRIVDINPSAEQLMDLRKTIVIGQPVDTICASLSELISRGHASSIAQAEIHLASDPSRSLDAQMSHLRDRRGRLNGYLIVLRDITERRQSEQTLRQLSRAVEQSPVTVVITDTRGNIEYVNPKFSQLTGYRFEEAIGKNPRILKSGQTPPEEYERLWKIITAGGVWHGEFVNKKKNGELYWESAVISPITNAAGVITHFVAVKEDITERKQTEGSLQEANARLQAQLREIEGLHAQVREQAIRDSLTGLFNRRYLVETFERELARGARENRSVGVVLMDVDHFKTINDTFGHQAGDMMLQALGELLRTTTRQMDVACRHGGEEFIVVLAGSTLAATRRRAEIWRQAVETLRVSYDGHLLNATISVGVAMFPEHGATGDDLTHAADHALYAAKAAGRNCVMVWK